MSLRVWLPLLGNTDNQGMSEKIFTVSNSTYITVNNAGKLGKCYNFNSSAINNGIYSPDSGFMNKYINNHSFSLCAWINIASTITNTPIMCLSYGLRLIAGNTSNTRLNLYNSTLGHVNCMSSVALNDGIWHHFAGTYDVTTNKMAVYVDGINTGNAIYPSGTYSSSWTNGLFIGRDPNSSSVSDAVLFKGKMNDIRIYDHALSPKEIKEISKGLVAHYTFGDSYLEGTTNLCTTSDCLSSTCYNGATGKYGYGTNTDIYKTTGIFNGKFCTKVYMGTSGNSARPYPYVNNMFVSNGTNQPKNKTISFDYYGTIGTYINPYKLGSGSATCDWRNNATATKSGTFTNYGAIPVVPNRWNHISFTLTGTTDANAEWGYIILGDTHTSDTSNYWLFANLQIEAKDHETGYAGVGGTRNETTVYDSSGYNYHGTKSGTLIVDSNTPRYSVSTQFSSGSHIYTPVIDIGGFANTYTFAWWGKIVNYTSHMMWGFSNGNRLNLYMSNSGNNFYWNTGDGNSNNFGTIKPSDYANTWHHFTITGDGTTTKLYIDGEYKVNAKTYKGITGTTIYLNGWDSSASYNFNGNLSDFRLYSTCLSADDILELYHTGASIDHDGNMYAYELKEV